jgi:phage tail sheath gpL-like
MTLLIPGGLTGQRKTPGAMSEVRNGQASGNIGQFPRPMLIAGYKASGSSLTDFEVFPILDPIEGINAAGVSSELAQGIEVATQTPGVMGLLYGLAIPEPTGGSETEATATLTWSGTATAAGSVDVHVDGKMATVDIAPNDTAATLAARFDTRWATIFNAPCSSLSSSAVNTLTSTHTAARENDHVLWVDKTNMPAGINVVAAGGTAFANGAVPFTGGVGTDASNLSSILAATAGIRFDYSAWALNEAASVDDIANQAATKAGPTGVGPENVVIGFNGTVSNAVTRSQVMNQVLAQCAWMEARVHPFLLACALAALRTVREAEPVTPRWGNPNHRFDFEELYGIPPHFKDTQSPDGGVTDTALNGGVTPIITHNGRPAVSRSITSRSLDGANPDYRTLDTATAVVPQRIREDLDLLWTQEHSVENPYVGPDLPNGQSPPAGRSTPTLWAGEINSRLREAEEANLITDVDNNPAAVEYNTTLKCLISNVPTVVQPQNHITGTVIRQIPA